MNDLDRIRVCAFFILKILVVVREYFKVFDNDYTQLFLYATILRKNILSFILIVFSNVSFFIENIFSIILSSG
jgi:hypothetical protein